MMDSACYLKPFLPLVDEPGSHMQHLTVALCRFGLTATPRIKKLAMTSFHILTNQPGTVSKASGAIQSTPQPCS